MQQWLNPHYLCMDSLSTNDKVHHNTIQAAEPDGTHIASIIQCGLKIKDTPQGASKAYKFKHLAGNSLISLPMFADQGCTTSLDKDKIVVTKNETTIMSGYREKRTRLWIIPSEDRNTSTSDSKTHTINTVVPEGNVKEVLGFISKTLLSSKQSTLVQTI